MPRASKADLPTLVARHLRLLASGKKNYKKSDVLLDELEKQLEPGQIVKLPNGTSVKFVDKFAGKNRMNVGMNARRYEFEEVTTA